MMNKTSSSVISNVHFHLHFHLELEEQLTEFKEQEFWWT